MTVPMHHLRQKRQLQENREGKMPLGFSLLEWIVLGFIAVFAIAIYAYSAMTLRTIAGKTNTPKRWLAWIPAANVYLMILSARIPGSRWFMTSIVLLLILFAGSFFFWDPAEAFYLTALTTAAISMLNAPVLFILPALTGGLSGVSDVLSAATALITAVVIIAMHTFLWWKIAQARQKHGWLALLMLIPVVNLIVMGLIAWKD